MTAESSCLPVRAPKEVLGLCIAQGIAGGTSAFLPTEEQQNGLGGRILVCRVPDMGPGMMKLRQDLSKWHPKTRLPSLEAGSLPGILSLVDLTQAAFFPARISIH